MQASLRNQLYCVAGVGFLFLAKAKHLLRGYSSPKPFTIHDYDRCCQYDFRVVDRWLSWLADYTGKKNGCVGKTVLELGPGSDLGIGLYLLAKGVAQYHAIDVNNLVQGVPTQFYERLFELMRGMDIAADVPFLQDQLASQQKGITCRLNYMCRADFDILSAFGKNSVDIIFSQAAFEHFDEVDRVIAQLSQVARDNAILVAEIDLQTHSRWIRERDPNNIYRYGDKLYDMFRFKGAPNRLRPYQYREVFEKYGWRNVVVTPLSTLGGAGGSCVVNERFRHERNQMDYLSIMMCATKS